VWDFCGGADGGSLAVAGTAPRDDGRGILLDFGLYGGIITLQWQGGDMKGVVFISVLLALAFAAALLAQAQPPPDRQQARQLAEQILNGREVIIRLYADPTNNPRAFDRLAVKLDGLYVTLEGVRLTSAGGKTADAVDVSFKQLAESGQAARTTLGRLVQSAQKIGPVFEQIRQAVELIEQATGRKFVDFSRYVDYESHLAPSIWSLPGLIADSASTAGSAVKQMLASARGDVTLDKMLQGGKTFQTAVPTIDLWAKNLGPRLASVVSFAEAVKTKLDPNAENAGQVQAAVDRIVQLGQKSAPTIEQIAKDGETLRVASKAIESSVRPVEQALDKMLEQKVVVVVAEDQTDQAVAAVVGEFIYAHDYRFGGAFSIWPRELAPPRYQWCLFQDADKQPVASATVEVMIGRGYQWKEGVWLWIRQTKLDEQARLKTPRAGSGGFDKFVFMVHCPDFAEVPVGPHVMELPNEPHLIYTVPVLPKDKWCVFKDALGNAIPNATVEIFQGVEWRKDISGPAATVKLDEKGRLKPLLSDPKLEFRYFIVSHPDYGTALAEPRRFIRTEGPLAECIVPMVGKGTEVDSRSVWGKVTNGDGNRVAGAVIVCDSLVSAYGSLLRLAGFSLQQVRAITDQQGQFAFYLPVTVEGQPQLVPLGAKYHLSIDAPEELNVPHYVGSVPSGQETTIVMGPAFVEIREFIFEDEFGPVTDPNMLQQVRYEFVSEDGHGKSGGMFTLWLKQGKFQPGTYYATADWNGKHYVFEPVKLSQDSPEAVVFRPVKIEPAETIHRGLVVHGITGQPIAGALVMKRLHLSDVNTADLDEKKVEAIFQLGPELEPNDPVFELLSENFKSRMMSITDADGNFQINLPKDDSLPMHSIVALKKNFLGAQQQLQSLPADANSPDRRWHGRFLPERNGYVTLPPMKLFPAGGIIIEPNLPADSKARRFTLNWFNFPGDKPDWFEAMGDYTYPNKNQGASLFYRHDLLPGTVQKVYVAAGLEMTLQIQVQAESQWDPVVVPNVKLEQGEVLDLGRVDFGPALKVKVMLIDSSGQPVEGITVRQVSENGLFWGRWGVTNTDGIAFLNVARYSKGKFVVQDYAKPPPQKRLLEGIAYQIGGQEDAGKEFTLRLSDEILNLIFK